MSIYGKLAGSLVALTLFGGSAAYVADYAGDVLAAAEQTAAELSCYVIREYNGGVALFLDGTEEPLAIYSMPADSLNTVDMELLHEGIRLRGLSEVSRLIEDLGLGTR